MHCIACGKPVQGNTRFCIHGGAPLRAAQADPDVKTVNGCTVLMIASGAGEPNKGVPWDVNGKP